MCGGVDIIDDIIIFCLFIVWDLEIEDDFECEVEVDLVFLSSEMKVNLSKEYYIVIRRINFRRKCKKGNY